ncbi:hypothetical protein [Desulfopila sp. IMCC35008]|uniref:hypothetical protein n=1 Tax=Desulfopila sp. IMCC35008 TaxID=2653858 RepID=UPI0013D46849|nr:hypothetical protein [Desulfopila sp. IMCC35008]
MGRKVHAFSFWAGNAYSAVVFAINDSMADGLPNPYFIGWAVYLLQPASRVQVNFCSIFPLFTFQGMG